jgi:DNA-binding Lrp family transcriptional regulator
MDLGALTLFGRARYRVLACLYGLPASGALHLREIARRTGLSPAATQYELRRLLAAGLIAQAGATARPLYTANPRHPVAAELRDMLRKLDAAREPEPIADDAYWSRKRRAQRRDYAAGSARRKSPFLAERGLTASFSADLRKESGYDY